MKTVLIIAEHFPPAFSVGGKRPYRFARYLPEHGWRPVILTAPEPSPSRSDTTHHPLPEEAVLDRSLFPCWWPESKGGSSDGTRPEPSRDSVSNPGLLTRVREGIDFPLGPKRFLIPHVLRRIDNLVERYAPDAIFITLGPSFLAAIGGPAKKKMGLPVCLDFRDPWSLNFHQRKKPKWFRAAEARIERRSLNVADRVLFTCEEAAEAYRELYPEFLPGRVRTLYNSFDPAYAPIPSEVDLRQGPVDLLHFGNCYGPRKLEPVIRAIHKLRIRRVRGAERLRVVNLGRPAATDLELVKKLGLEASFKSDGVLPYSEGIRRLSMAPLQLLVGYGQEKLYVPAKTFDYFLSGAPMLSLSESTELASLVEKTGSGFSARPNDIEAVAQVLSDVLKAAADGERVCEPRREDVEQYSAPNAAGQLARVLDEMVSPRC